IDQAPPGLLPSALCLLLYTGHNRRLQGAIDQAPLGLLPSAFCLLPSYTVTGSRAFSDSSTAGGTRRATSPPRRKTSFTRREETYVYSTAGSMKIVSTCAFSSRFMSAICSSYS